VFFQIVGEFIIMYTSHMADQSVSVFVRELTFVLLAISACLMNIYVNKSDTIILAESQQSFTQLMVNIQQLTSIYNVISTLEYLFQHRFK
jgi:hypothetical protein